MGKGRNKNKEKDQYTGPMHKGRDEDSDSDESVSTHLTFDDDMRSVQGDVEDVDSDLFIDSLSEHIENASHKNVNIRVAALRKLQVAFTSHYLPEFIGKYKATILDFISKNLRRTDDECASAAVLLALVALQIGDEISQEVEEPLQVLRPIVMDPARPEALRALAALSIALAGHLASENDESIATSIRALRHAWGNIKVGAHTSRLFTCALPGWALLLQSVNDATTLNAALTDYSKLSGYLEAEQLDTRITAGEVIAYIYEFMGESRHNYRFPNHDQVVNILSSLVSDCAKSKTKRDKRVQRCTFRQIHSSIVHREPPEIKIKFNHETLVLDSCSAKLFYDLACEILHGGMLRQLQQNEIMRDMFDLGPVSTGPTEKINKFARMAMHDANTKYRQQVRGKQRDKRSVL